MGLKRAQWTRHLPCQHISDSFPFLHPIWSSKYHQEWPLKKEPEVKPEYCYALPQTKPKQTQNVLLRLFPNLPIIRENLTLQFIFLAQDFTQESSSEKLVRLLSTSSSLTEQPKSCCFFLWVIKTAHKEPLGFLLGTNVQSTIWKL